MLNNVLAANAGPLTEEHVRAIWSEIFSTSRHLQRPLRVAYFGPQGTYTHQAAEAAAQVRFGSFVEYIPLRTVEDVFNATERGNADYGVVPVENSTEGSVGQTLDLFMDSPLKICAEILLRINHHLIGKGPLEAVEKVYSHPQALGQCRRWLSTQPAQGRAGRGHLDLGGGAHGRGGAGVAAIGSEEAAVRYERAGARPGDPGPGPQHHPLPAHRAEHRAAQRTGQDVHPVLRARPGGRPARRALRLRPAGASTSPGSSSRPSRRQPWEYVFFVDFAGHPDEANAAAALVEMHEACTTVKVLGAWPVERRVDGEPRASR